MSYPSTEALQKILEIIEDSGIDVDSEIKSQPSSRQDKYHIVATATTGERLVIADVRNDDSTSFSPSMYASFLAVSPQLMQSVTIHLIEAINEINMLNSRLSSVAFLAQSIDLSAENSNALRILKELFDEPSSAIDLSEVFNVNLEGEEIGDES